MSAANNMEIWEEKEEKEEKKKKKQKIKIKYNSPLRQWEDQSFSIFGIEIFIQN